MSLTIAERRKLRRVERALTCADPLLAGRYAIFTRLNRHENMPRIERLLRIGPIRLILYQQMNRVNRGRRARPCWCPRHS